jgi:hypothetical protein
VLGFLVMLGSALLGVTAWRRLQLSRGRGATPKAASGPVAPKQSVLERFEERWKRRRDDKGF